MDGNGSDLVEICGLLKHLFFASLGNISNRTLWHVLFEPLESGKETFPKLREDIVFIDIFIKTCSDKMLPYLRISLIVKGYPETAELLVMT